MFFELPPEPPKIWLPPKPAIIRQVTPDLIAPKREMLSRARRRAAGAIADITVADDGDFAVSSGANTTALTFNSVITTKGTSFALITWKDASTLTLSSATWGGNACSILVQQSSGSSTRIGCAIIAISGAQTGNLVLNFSAACDDAEVTAISADNVQSLTPVDTDATFQEFGSATSVDLDALTAPGVGGVRLAVEAHFSSGTAITWTNATEVSDLATGTYRHSAAYDLGNNGTTISTSVSTNSGFTRVICGVSIR